jgi:hypothetical protein
LPVTKTEAINIKQTKELLPGWLDGCIAELMGGWII